MLPIWIALGANLEDPAKTLRQADRRLAEFFSIQARSSLYHSAPHGVTDQPEFVNAVIQAETALHPQEVLGVLHRIEDEFGRVRTRHWGPRALDLDLLGYGDWRYRGYQLALPHPEIAKRCFVLAPLREVDPTWTERNLGVSYDEAWQALDASEREALGVLERGFEPEADPGRKRDR